MKRSLLVMILAVTASSLLAQPLLMDPDISPDGNTLTFSYQGDIWTVPASGGRADRITIHEGYDGRPYFTPDGQRIAFSSDRYGNADIYLIEADGGNPIRLTHHSASDAVCSVTPNGEILFMTRRAYAQVERESEIYKVSPSSGTPTRYMDALGFDAVVSPDGNKVAFVRGTCRIDREGYRGPANRDIWVFDMNSGEYSQVTDFEGNDFSPRWIDNNTIAYITPRSGKYNIHSITLEGNDTQLTEETEFGVYAFGLSSNTSKAVYQTSNHVFVFDVNTKTKSEPQIDVSSDYRFDPIVTKKVSNGVSDFAVSPNGKFSAFIHRGEVFVTRNDKEDSKAIRLTNHAARERDVEWLNDEKLLFISDREGQNDLYIISSTDSNEKDLFYSLKREVKRITNTPEEEFNPNVSPDGEKIGFRQGRGKYIVANIDEAGKLSSQNTLIDGWDTPEGVSWSPDSKWLAYGLADLNFNQEVFIHAADGSKDPVNVTMHPKYDGSPVWSPDGSKLGFISMRNNGDNDVWFVWLKEEDWERSNEEWKRFEKEAGDKEDKKSEDEEEEEFVVQIDFDNIYNRVERVTGFAGAEVDFAFDKKGEFIYYSTGPDWRRNYKFERMMYKIKWDGSDNKEISGTKNPGGLTPDSKNEYLYYVTNGGKMNRLNFKSDKTESLTVSGSMEVNYKAELKQLFEEGWRALNAGFYDPNFHGQDWDALKAKYQPIALSGSTKEDFQVFFNLMLGQLNASHMGMYRGENQKQTQRDQTGQIGIEGENTKDGFRVSRIVPKSPAAKNESKLNVGDVITSVNQQPVDTKTNFFALMKGTVNEKTLLEVENKGQKRDVIIWPVNSLRSMLYDEWVDDRRKLVEQFSNGKLGYLHIQGMNWTSFERFERELMAAGYGKEGIVIDVRYNGGGWTTDYLMAVLTVRQHAYTIPRGATESLDNHLEFKDTYPFGERLPLAAWTKPSVALCNANSYSNAEIFSHAYKTLDLGTLVGIPTFGAVISTGGTTLQDGSLVRMPFRAWYVRATEENMELGPAVPDIVVENPPAYRAKNVDPQLRRAVDELMK